MVCTYCGTTIEKGMTFCSNCGNRINAQPAPAAAPAPKMAPPQNNLNPDPPVLLYHVRPARFVWGAILLVVAIVVFSISMMPYLMATSSGFNEAEAAPFLLLPLILCTLPLLIGSLLLIFGFVNVSKVKRLNREILSRGAYAKGTCYRCGAGINVHISKFQRHGRFPKGFIYCPGCRIPLSIERFTVTTSANDIPRDQMMY